MLTAVKVVLQVILLALASFGISTLMEWYKKVVRKNEAKDWEIRLVAAGVSVVAALVFYLTGFFTPILSALWPSVSVWFDVALYAVVIFLLQWFGDQQLVKDLLKEIIKRTVTVEDLTPEIKALLENFKNKTGIDAQTVALALKFAGVTVDGVKKVLKEIGLDDEEIEQVIQAYKDASGIIGNAVKPKELA